MEQRAHSERLQEQLRQAQSQSGPVVGEITGSRSLRARQQFGDRLHAVCAQAAERITQAEQVESQRRTQFQEARRETLVIEKLQERARDRARHAQRKAEQSILDDFVASRFGD